mgnify:CR=1 FL=1
MKSLDITYENMRSIVDILPLTIDDDTVHRDKKIKIFCTHELFLYIKGLIK